MLDRLQQLSDAEFAAVKRQYAAESAQADRDGGDTNSIASDYWDGWLDTMTREEFAMELFGEDEMFEGLLAEVRAAN